MFLVHPINAYAYTALKARANTASTKKINAQLSTMDASGSVSMLERIKEQVEEEELTSRLTR